MSFGLPSLKVKPDHAGGGIQVQEGAFGVPDPLVAGLQTSKPKLGMSHPLEVSEKNFHMNMEKMDMAMLRNTQGLHAPMKLSLERKFATKVGHLPFLPSSNLQHEVLTGRYLDIGFEDILNQQDTCEVAGLPSAVMERSMGLL